MSSAAQVLAAAPALEALAQLRAEHPLAFATLWHNAPPRTSQRAPLQRAGVDSVLAAGGNGSGKTELGGQVACAVAMSRSHPAVATWIKRNQIEPSLIPPKPGIVLASSLNSTMSINIQRAAVERYAPAGTEWRNRDGPGFSEARFPGGGRVRFLTNDAGARAMQGYAGHCLWLDEEHDESIYREGMQRLTRRVWEGRSGWCLLTMTPLKGFTWVHRSFIADPDPGSAVFFLHGGDNPHIDQAKRARLLRGVNEGERAARDRGEFTQLEGRVFTEWSRPAHVVQAHAVPDDWPLYAGWDFGTRAPTAIVLCALDPSDDTLHVISEVYQAQRTTKENAAAYRRMLAGREVEWLVCDPEDKAARMALGREYGVPNIPAKKGPGSVRKGINDLSERLAINLISGRPALVVHDCCTNLISEIESYVWAPTRSGEVKDAPAPRQRDHAIDALRYLVSRLAGSSFGVG